jgi:hypothetical protein
VRAEVQPAPSGLTVRLRDDAGRTAVREVSSELVAAMWIESWTRRELGAALLPAPIVGAAPEHDRLAAAPTTQPTPLSFHVATRSVSGSDDVSSRSFGAGLCVMVGPVCVGGEAHVDQRGDLSANEGLTRARRLGADALASVCVPVPIGRATIAPSLGLGLGYLRTNRQEPDPTSGLMDPGCADPPPNTDPMDPNQPPEPCTELPPIYVGDGFGVHSLGVRVHGGLGLSVPITASVSLELSAGITLAPTAHRTAFAPDDGQSMPGPNGMDELASDPLYWLPGEALRSTYWGVGLRVGRP